MDWRRGGVLLLLLCGIGDEVEDRKLQVPKNNLSTDAKTDYAPRLSPFVVRALGVEVVGFLVPVLLSDLLFVFLVSCKAAADFKRVGEEVPGARFIGGGESITSAGEDGIEIVCVPFLGFVCLKEN